MSYDEQFKLQFKLLEKFFAQPLKLGAGGPYTFETIDVEHAESPFGGMLERIAEDGKIVEVRDCEGTAVQWHAPSQWAEIQRSK